jgi:hypothetical protein
MGLVQTTGGKLYGQSGHYRRGGWEVEIERVGGEVLSVKMSLCACTCREL